MKFYSIICDKCVNNAGKMFKGGESIYLINDINE